jgi:putative FmdB family regulatory protein
LPTYEYRCDSCEKNFDVVQSFQDDALTACPTCGSPVRKVFGSVGIVFKGSGFYKTDSRPGGSAKTAPAEGSSTDSSGSGGSDGSGTESSTPATTSSGDGSAKPASKEPTTPSPAPSAPKEPAKTSPKDGTS